MESDKARLKEILEWAMHNRAEENFEKEYYYWTQQAKRILTKLTFLEGECGDRLLIGIIGQSGIGKSALLSALRSKLWVWVENKCRNEWNVSTLSCRVKVVKWYPRYLKDCIPEVEKDSHPDNWEYAHTIFIDTPDYGRKDARRINKDLDTLFLVWRSLRESRDTNVNIVIFLQKELVKRQQHFFLRKMDLIELKPLTTNELIEAFKMRFKAYEPFTEESLHLVAELSRGIFRRFMRYIQLCLETLIEQGTSEVPIALVKKVITNEVLMEDMELEFLDIFRNERYVRYAVKILEFLRERKRVNQKTIAETLGIHASILGRIISTLEENGYVKRIRGKGKTLNIEVQ